jgi:hypothetical protein
MEISVPQTPPTKPQIASKSTVAASESPIRQQRQPEEIAATEVTPKPSLFPPSLNYTPPSSSLGPYLPRPFKATTPAPAAAVQPVETKPANPKLEDLYHIYLDAKGFEYKLILLRSNHYLNNFARYDLRMYESHTMPHMYCTVARYIPPAGAKPGAVPTSVAQNSDQPAAQIGIASTPFAQPGQLHNPAFHPAAAHIQSLITRPLPSTSAPYRTAIAPPNSEFQPAFRAFRHAFRDLTLLSWHERLDPALQRLRAQAFCIEPFVWRRPAEGLPTGVDPPFFAPFGEETDVQLEGYKRNAWGLPALDEPLGKEGSIGSALFREAVDARRREEEKRKEEERRAAQEKFRAKRGKTADLHALQKRPGVAGPQHYDPQQRQMVDSNRAALFGAGGADGGESRASTPAMQGTAQRSGRAVIIDYRTAQQKRFDTRFDY